MCGKFKEKPSGLLFAFERKASKSQSNDTLFCFCWSMFSFIKKLGGAVIIKNLFRMKSQALVLSLVVVLSFLCSPVFCTPFSFLKIFSPLNLTFLSGFGNCGFHPYKCIAEVILLIIGAILACCCCCFLSNLLKSCMQRKNSDEYILPNAMYAQGGLAQYQQQYTSPPSAYPNQYASPPPTNSNQYPTQSSVRTSMFDE